jgi:hypothetical protein
MLLRLVGLYPWVTAIISPTVSTVGAIAASLMQVGFFVSTSADLRHGDITAIQKF